MKSAMCVAALLLAAGCSRPNAADAPKKEEPPVVKAAHSDEDKHEELPRRVSLAKDVVAAAKIKTARVAREPFAASVDLPGEIASDPDRTARISTPAAGRLVRVSFREGARVARGDVLGAVRVTDVASVRAAYAAAASKAAAARANAERLGALSERGLSSTQEAVSARSEATALDAEARGLAEKLGALGLGTTGGGSEILLRAPASGVVLARDAVVGQPVSADQSLGTIADLSEVWFLARVFEKDLVRLEAGSKTEVALNAYPNERFSGTVEYVGRQVDPVARTVTARIRITAADERLRVGLFGTARVGVAGRSAAAASLLVPRTAVVDVGGKPSVFVREADGDFEVHDVVAGRSSLGKIEIVSGLREGEEIVTEGAFTLKSVVLKSTLAEED